MEGSRNFQHSGNGWIVPENQKKWANE
jgi:hypothetical protein